MIKVESLVKCYNKFTAVKGIDFEIARGEIFGLLGPNGAGKTSTISIISGLHKPTSGTVCINGLDTQKRTQEVRRLVGVVPQELAIYPTITARDNLAFFGRVYGLKGQELKRRIAEVLDIVGLSERARDVVTAYSGGMKRRLNLACGLLHAPAVLLLDEPTVGVDPQSRNLIFEQIRYLSRQYGMTVIYTTHYMEEAENLCARVGIMDQGKIVALDTPRALIDRLGQGVITMKTSAAAPGISETLKALAGVRNVSWTHGVLTVRASEAYKVVVDILAFLKEHGIALESLQIKEASLENVFLNLTGKSVRDPGSAPETREGAMES
jgi:ABC-2 type transport system ATP-binding protein